MALLLLFHVLKKIHAQKNVLAYEKNCLNLGKKLFFFWLTATALRAKHLSYCIIRCSFNENYYLVLTIALPLNTQFFAAV